MLSFFLYFIDEVIKNVISIPSDDEDDSNDHDDGMIEGSADSAITF